MSRKDGSDLLSPSCHHGRVLWEESPDLCHALGLHEICPALPQHLSFPRHKEELLCTSALLQEGLNIAQKIRDDVLHL